MYKGKGIKKKKFIDKFKPKLNKTCIIHTHTRTYTQMNTNIHIYIYIYIYTHTQELFVKITLSAGAVEYADCTSAEGYLPPNEVTCWPWVATHKALGQNPSG